MSNSTTRSIVSETATKTLSITIKKNISPANACLAMKGRFPTNAKYSGIFRLYTNNQLLGISPRDEGLGASPI